MRLLIILFSLIFFNLTLYSQKNIELEGSLSYSSELNDIWGYSDTAGNEYALVGRTDGFSIVNINDPANLQEDFYIAGTYSTWRDIKVWNNHAYIVHDSNPFGPGGDGLLIVDLTGLPDSINSVYWTSFDWNGVSLQLATAHNIFIDEKGFAYLFGFNDINGDIPVNEQGALILDLTADPENPVQAGVYKQAYIHDGFVRGDTMWAGEIYNGWFSAVDVSDPSAPSVMATHPTPNFFTHNLWLSDDGNRLFTTDEKSSAYIAEYDVSDLDNIQETARFRSGHSEGVIPHNTFFLDGFLITSYYRDGVIINDVNAPGNIIEIGYYDTSPLLEGDGFNGCWGVYPYLPSGRILATDIEEGLFVLNPDYQKACYLEGTVTDSISGSSLNNAIIEILNTEKSANSDLSGKYATGVADSGTYSIAIQKTGYFPDTITGIMLDNGTKTIVDIELTPAETFTFNGQVTNKSTGKGIANAKVIIENYEIKDSVFTDVSGNYTIPAFKYGIYNIVVAKWGYKVRLLHNTLLNKDNSIINITISEGYYDDFITDFDWKTSATAVKGLWERSVPVETSFNNMIINPGEDIPDDNSDLCYVTGNGGGSPGDDDIDDGRVVLRSPVIDLSGYKSASLVYYRWFFNGGGNSTPDDSLIVKISNGNETKVLEVITSANSSEFSQWIKRSFTLSNYLKLTDSMHVFFEASDLGDGHLVEAGIDGFEITGEKKTNLSDLSANDELNILISPNPFGENTKIEISGNTDPSDIFEIMIYNVTGQKIEHFSTTEKSIQWGTDLQAGIYFIRVLSDNGQYISKRMIKVE